MHRKVALLAATAALPGAVLVAAVLPGAANAATSCSASLRTDSAWGAGFVSTVTVANTGSTPATGWTVSWTWPGNQTISNAWNAVGTRSGSMQTMVNAGYNGSLAPNASTTFGFQAAGTAASPVLSCTVAGSAPTPTATPTRTPTPTHTATPTAMPTPTTTLPTGSAPALHVSGNKLVTASGATYRLLGVNRSGGEFACIQGNGFWNGPMDAASVDAMRAWNVRTVRVPLNEECWLGTPDVPAAYGGAAYQAQVKAYVNLLISKGITPLVEMHWNYGLYTGPSSGCSDVKATCQKPMPDAQYAPAFWTGVANAFKGNDAVVFDLFNEPYPERATGSATSGWLCWRDGGTCPGIGYQVAGFQTLVNSVRATGATNVILVGGLAYSNDLSQWLTYKPVDPLNNLGAFAHIYNFNTCSTTSCWDSTYAPVAAAVPLTLSEIGENDCAHGFIDQVMSWADAHAVGYLGWTWNNWDCSTGPSLISDWNGTPTPFGIGFKNHLATVSN